MKKVTMMLALTGLLAVWAGPTRAAFEDNANNGLSGMKDQFAKSKQAAEKAAREQPIVAAVAKEVGSEQIVEGPIFDHNSGSHEITHLSLAGRMTGKGGIRFTVYSKYWYAQTGYHVCEIIQDRYTDESGDAGVFAECYRIPDDQAIQPSSTLKSRFEKLKKDAKEAAVIQNLLQAIAEKTGSEPVTEGPTIDGSVFSDEFNYWYARTSGHVCKITQNKEGRVTSTECYKLDAAPSAAIDAQGMKTQFAHLAKNSGD